MDMANFFPPETGTNFHFFIGAVCGPLFAITFTYYRVIAWWGVSRQMFEDSMYVLNSGISDKLRPGRNHVLYVMMTLNLLLGLMQLYWFQMIVGEALKLVGVQVGGPIVRR
jgi:hypothetical protein